MTFMGKQAGLLRSARSWGVLGLLLALAVSVGYGQGGQTACVPPPAGMTAWWPLDETSGTTANDLAGVPNNGTHVNGPTPVPGMVAGALRFDGVDDHVRVPDHAELNVGTGISRSMRGFVLKTPV